MTMKIMNLVEFAFIYHNNHLTNLKIITGEDFGINSDSKEALAFVVMGHQTLLGLPSNVKSVTGAKDYVVLGNITLNPLGYKNEQ